MKISLSKIQTSAFKGVGSNPSNDWFIILCFLVVAGIASAVWAGMHFYKVHLFLIELDTKIGNQNITIDKTGEEKLQDIAVYYKNKNEIHLALLSRSKLDTKKEQVATTSASTTPSVATSTSSAAL